MQLAYLVHDINDAAVKRRARLFRGAGVDLTVAGFRRLSEIPTDVAGAPVRDLGLTIDGNLRQRAMAVLRHYVRPGEVGAVTRDADVIVARNLETLVLADRVRRPKQRLVYECLDIHRMMLGDGPPSRGLRALERAILARAELVVVSSPAFQRYYFEERQGYRGATLLVENKVPLAPEGRPVALPTPAGPPWTIGWFGMLRCRTTLEQLSQIARAGNGAIRVLIAGIPSPAEFPDFAGQVGAVPHCEYVGRYTAADLPKLYGQCHFSWAIDYFEEGLNSSWLLPNRLYESIAYSTVPIALPTVETGRWLARNEAGMLIEHPVTQLPSMLQSLDAARYQALVEQVQGIPADRVFQSDAERRAIIERVRAEA